MTSVSSPSQFAHSPSLLTAERVRSSMTRSFANVFALADAAVGSLLQTEGSGLVLSIDIGDSCFEVVASNMAESMGFDFVRSPSLLRLRSQTVRRNASPESSDAELLPFAFGLVDGRLRAPDWDEPLDRYTPWLQVVATRSIDRWMTGRAPLRFAHFGDPGMAHDQISGASNTIARDQPILTLYIADWNRDRIRQLLYSLGYQPFDLTVESTETHGDEPASGFAWIAVPAHRKADLVSILEQTHRIPEIKRPPWQLEADRMALSRQRRSAAMFDLSAHPPIPPVRRIEADEIIGLSDCYPLEREAAHSWRWLGPRTSSRVAVPCPLPGAYEIELSVLGSQLENGIADCRIIVEGREVIPSISNSLPGSVTFAGHADSANFAGYMEISVVNPGKARSAGLDPRTLRACLESITVSHWQ